MNIKVMISGRYLKKTRVRVGVGGPENPVDHDPCPGPGPSGCSAHRPFGLGPDTRFEPLTVSSPLFLLPSFFFSVGGSFVRLLTRLTRGAQVHPDRPLTN